MKILTLLLVTLISTTVAFAVNWLALIPWRRAKDQHWTERARVYHPVRTGAVSNLLVIPAVLVLVAVVWNRPDLPSWIFIALFSSIGVLIGTMPMDREVFPRITMSDLLRQAGTGSFFRLLSYFVFLGAAALMPNEFNLQVPLILSAVILLWVFWSRELWLRVASKIGYLQPPPDRLQRTVNDCANRMNVTVRETLVLRFPLAQAFALPDTRKLLFTERLLELLTDEELATICSHELGHLTEKPGDYLKRYIILLTYLPWLLFKPMIHNFGALGFFILLGTTILVPKISRKLSHKLETRADEMAKTNEGDPGLYARALTRLYEDALLPAVVAKEQLTHPHLYDRLLAAGVTPDYPRPRPASSMGWNGWFFAMAVGALAALLILGKY
ncbi:MAG: M48 family metalloprotease [Verrucomicrobiota bacterium]